MRNPLLGVLALLAWAWAAHAAGRIYQIAEPIPIQANVLQPMIDAPLVRNIDYYDYYDVRLGFCQPDAIERVDDNAVLLAGNRIYNSPIQLYMMANVHCVPICTMPLPSGNADFLKKRIHEQYAINWLIDGLPVAHYDEDVENATLRMGFPIGRERPDGRFELYNHYDFHLKYHNDNDTLRVVGASVTPKSYARGAGELQCSTSNPKILGEGAAQVMYTYSVYWTPGDTTWGDRWRPYMVFDDALALRAFSAAAALILYFVVFRSSTRSKNDVVELTEDGQVVEMPDTFPELLLRPQRLYELSLMSGTGAQLLVVAAATMICGAVGIITPAPGSVVATLCVLWALAGIVSGFVSMYTHRLFRGEGLPMVLAAGAFPALVLAVSVFLSQLLAARQSAAALPFSTLVYLATMLGLGTLPSLVGALVGRRVRPDVPEHTGIPRPVPRFALYNHPRLYAVLAGLVSFSASNYQLTTIVYALLSNRAFASYGWLLADFVLTLAIAMLMSIFCCVHQLNEKDYRWQWQAFLAGGSGGIWLFVFGFLFWVHSTALPSLATNALFMCYVTLLAALYFLVFGFAGLAASYWFIRKIYSRTHMD
ncbi:hypothetical protein MCUN1_003353 [Malassezia cuniculi]|uniref:Transmembrane 9 superfamily member n=1 Tax=Malassezia cuniculi TaxID=948313 RepID=A0AAF0EWJ9_9BASI|nr:hypothetical protein MCUN1_003353 [Malassezia cuniculi]